MEGGVYSNYYPHCPLHTVTHHRKAKLGGIEAAQEASSWNINTPAKPAPAAHHGFDYATPHGELSPSCPFSRVHLTTAQLSKADEEAADEVEVRREDQDKINRFSRLHQRELVLEEELTGKTVRLHVPPISVLY